jgi:hypothetical protein
MLFTTAKLNNGKWKNMPKRTVKDWLQITLLSESTLKAKFPILNLFLKKGTIQIIHDTFLHFFALFYSRDVFILFRKLLDVG